MTAIPQPYIGVTDFTTRAQVEEVKQVLNKASGRRLHVGAMISRKTHLGLPTKLPWADVWLSPEGLKQLFVDDNEVFNVLHYADYNSGGEDTTLQHLLDVSDKAGKYMHGLQLDMIWPAVDMVNAFKRERPDVSIILQVSLDAIKDLKKRGELLSRALGSYSRSVDYILMDAGMGTGKELNPQEMIELMNQASFSFHYRQMAFGGGLGPKTFTNLVPLLKENPYLSCDAQGQLHPNKDLFKPINLEWAKEYVRKVSNLMVEYRR